MSKPAYVIFIRDKTTDPEGLVEYGKLAGAARGEHKITAHAFYGPHEVLEGPDAEGVVVISFPSKEEARAWYDSPAYQEAKARRVAASDYRVILVEGL